MPRIYRLLSWLVAPLIPFFLRWRERRGRENAARLQERLGVAGKARPEGRLAWFHAASMGESLSILPLIGRLSAAHPDLHILLTTVTVTSARYAAARLPAQARHQFVPVDTPGATRRFLNHWRPDLAFWVESELWPNLIFGARDSGCPLILLNGRISTRAARRWRKLPGLIAPMLRAFSLILAQSREDAERLASLGATGALVKGNLKFSAPPLEADAAMLENLREAFSGREIWLAASTHPQEEEIIAEAHVQLKAAAHPKLLTLLAPRHAERGDAIADMLRDKRLKVAQRSRGEKAEPDTDVYLADTMGELGVFFRLTRIVFIGGSLVSHGGQNPFEPARLGCAVLYGPFMDNFREFSQQLERVGGAARVTGADDLALRVEELLRGRDRREHMGRCALGAAEDTQLVLDRVLETIDPYVDALFE